MVHGTAMIGPKDYVLSSHLQSMDFINSFNTSPPGPGGGHGNQLLYAPPRAGGVTLGFRFGISNDKLLQVAACFH